VSELKGIAKTGGMADVAQALPEALAQLGHDVRVALPYYRQAQQHTFSEQIAQGSVWLNPQQQIGFAIRQVQKRPLPTYLIEHHDYFSREQLYNQGATAYPDNSERFAFFCQAALRLCQLLDYQPDIIHVNDWQTALLPYYLKQQWQPYFQDTRTVLTIHNAAFQQLTPADQLSQLSIDQRFFYPTCCEDNGQINLLRCGIAFADKITTVSPGYAKELLTPLGSHGLVESFQRRQKDLVGILNGCDYQEWDPDKDPLIPANYSQADLSGKRQCKAALQQRLGLPEHPDIGLFGLVSRLSSQKGFDYLLPALHQLLTDQQPMQVVLLGTGDSWISGQLAQLQQNYPDCCRFIDGFNNELAHWIEAGSDFFLMPSLFEPCGLNQLYSLKYGTLPIVRQVGGLKDSVQPYGEATQATGFMFAEPQPTALADCIKQALMIYQQRNQTKEFHQLVQNAMNQDFSWRNSASVYNRLYQQLTNTVENYAKSK
jgi:starch synthase